VASPHTKVSDISQEWQLRIGYHLSDLLSDRCFQYPRFFRDFPENLAKMERQKYFFLDMSHMLLGYFWNRLELTA